MIVTSNLIQTPKVVTIDQNRWSRSVKFTGHDLLEWVVTVDQNTHNIPEDVIRRRFKSGLDNFHKRYSKVVNSWALFDSYHRPPKLIDWSNK